MASKDLKYNLRIDHKDAKKALEETGDAADDTRTKAQKLADALEKLSTDAEAELDDLRSASDVMATALGDDFVRAKQEAGKSVDQIVLGLQEMGLSFDDIRGDADQLADAVKRLDAVRVNVDNLGTSAKNLGTDLDRVHTSGDQSRSVLANMVGNSTQDLAGLGGVAGTLGMALGQVGEYATEGGINMASLAKIAGPMAALTVGTIALSAAVKAVGSEAREARREEELWHDIHEDLLDDKFAEAAEKLRSEWEDTLPILRDLGLSEKDLVDILNGQGDVLATLTSRHEDLGTAIANQTDQSSTEALALREEYNLLDALLENLNEGIAAREADVATTKAQTESAAAFEAALRGLTDTQASVINKTRIYSDAVNEAKLANEKAETATRNLEAAYADLLGVIDNEQAWLDLQDAMDAHNTLMLDSTTTDREKRQSLLDIQESLLSYLGSLEGVPAEKQTEILALIDQEKWNEANTALEALAATRTVYFKPVSTGSNISAFAAGTPPQGAPGGLALVGESGPELVDLPRGARVTPADETSRLLSASVTQNVYGPGWGVASRQHMLMDAGRLQMLQRGNRRRA